MNGAKIATTLHRKDISFRLFKSLDRFPRAQIAENNSIDLTCIDKKETHRNVQIYEHSNHHHCF